MRITFIIPSVRIAGGVRVVFEYANRLKERGHNVSIVYPLIPLSFGSKWYHWKRGLGWGGRFLRNFKRNSKVDWFDVKANLKMVPSLSEKYIPEGDIIVATAWPTAYYVDDYPECKGEKVYFIQHYEGWSGPQDKVNKTYKLPLRKIVISSWLKDLMEKRFQERVEGIVMDGINLDQFYNSHKEYNEKKRILMYYSKWKWKGAQDGIRAFEIAKEKCPELQLVMFGLHKGHDVPSYAEFHKRPTGERLRKLYCSCDIFLYSSRCEGFGLPPMEAMACKCAVVATNVGAVPDYTIPGKTALVSPPGDPTSLAQNLISLLNDNQRLKDFSIAGYEYIKEFSWEESTRKLEKLFENLVTD